jgi:predicted ester cyclase
MTHLPITQVATTDITMMLSPGPDRRMDLPGFAPEFVDFPHYIIAITETIWHERQVERCLDWYSSECVIHTMAGPVVGAQAVVDNTWATLAVFPDRRLDGDNVIWSEEEGSAFYSSHLITSKMTHLGDGDFGPATGRKVLVRTIADCLCKDNRIIEEWLVRDNLALVEQLGLDAGALARQQASNDRVKGHDLYAALAPLRAAHASREPWTGATGTAAIALELLAARWGPAPDGLRATELCDFRLGAWVPGGKFLYGPDQMAGFLDEVQTCFSDGTLGIAHVATTPYLEGATDVAVCWTWRAQHTENGRYGVASGADVLILAVSHFRIMNGRVREEVTIWDDLALRRQIEGQALGHKSQPNEEK